MLRIDRPKQKQRISKVERLQPSKIVVHFQSDVYSEMPHRSAGILPAASGTLALIDVSLLANQRIYPIEGDR